MQKRNLLYLSILAAVIFCFSYAQAALQFLPRYQGSYGTRNQEGGRDKIEITCASLGGVEKGTNQTCTGQFIRAGLTCYKSCSCNKSKFQYTIASHQGSGKLCESLSNACTDSAGTSYSNCVLNTCNVRNSTWISESSKSSYTSNNYTCTTQNTSGKDGTCYVCACPSSWATGSCPANSATCSTCKAISPYTVSKFNLVSCKAGYYKNGNSCTQCPAGSACDGINKTLCPAGSYSAAGASSCSQCQAGTYSAAGASSCSQCQAGTYSTAGSSKCLDCSAGTYSNKGASSCTSCPAGKYSSAKASYCNPCSAGTYSKGGASSCSYCKPGTYSGREASECSKCVAGTYSSVWGASKCDSCPSGKYSAAGASSCNSCTGNTYSTGGASSCTSCSSGSVANSSHTECLNDTCGSGYTKTACNSNQIQTGTTATAAGSTCYACRAKTCSDGGYVASCPSGQSGTSVSYANLTCYKDCKNPCDTVTAVSIPANAYCSSYHPNCSSKCAAWSCNSGYNKSENSCVMPSCDYEVTKVVNNRCYCSDGCLSFTVNVQPSGESIQEACKKECCYHTLTCEEEQTIALHGNGYCPNGPGCYPQYDECVSKCRGSYSCISGCDTDSEYCLSEAEYAYEQCRSSR